MQATNWGLLIIIKINATQYDVMRCDFTYPHSTLSRDSCWRHLIEPCMSQTGANLSLSPVPLGARPFFRGDQALLDLLAPTKHTHIWIDAGVRLDIRRHHITQDIQKRARRANIACSKTSVKLKKSMLMSRFWRFRRISTATSGDGEMSVFIVSRWLDTRDTWQMSWCNSSAVLSSWISRLLYTCTNRATIIAQRNA